MTLAVILLNVLWFVSPVRGGAPWLSQAAAAPGNSSDAATQGQQSQGQQSQGQQSQAGTDSSQPSQTAPPAASQPSASSTQTAPSNPPSKPKPPRPASSAANKGAHKKKVAALNCNPAPTASASAAKSSTGMASGPATQAANPSSAGVAQDAKGSSAPTNCPPKKVIVSHGSAPEPSIQLAGDAGGSALRQTGECHDAGRCLQTADENLKKIAGRQLSSSQRDMLTQVRQFIAQSKKATTEGDLESARTLAWKAQLLSEELVNPEK